MANGYTHITDSMMWELFDIKISGREFNVLMVIIKKTVGYGKKADTLSYGQISELTGISRRNVIRAIKALEDKNIIKVSRRSGKICKITLLLSGVKTDTSTGVKNGHKVVSNSTPTNKMTKATSTDLPLTSQSVEKIKEDEIDEYWLREEFKDE